MSFHAQRADRPHRVTARPPVPRRSALLMVACAVLGASVGCYDYHDATLGDPPESEEIVPPCTEADAGADAADAGADAAEDAPTD